MPPNSDNDDNFNTVAIIENISTLSVIDNGATNEIDNVVSGEEQHQGNAQNDAVGTPEVEDEMLSLSTATSATSIASALSDGEARPRSTPRARSQSFSIYGRSSSAMSGDSERPHSQPRHASAGRRSTPRSRPRSNPRTRTPMRQESPLLITGRGDNIVFNQSAQDPTANDNHVSTHSNSEETMIRNIFNTRRRIRSDSIPEEVISAQSVEQGDQDVNLTTTTSTSTSNAPRAGHLLTSIRETNSRIARRSTNPTRSRLVGLSDKQNPSHRKLRRWNNDRFVGTSSEQLHLTLQNNEALVTEQYWREFYMPNYPCEYQSEFARLITDETPKGNNVRERFLKGEIANISAKRRKEKKVDDGMTWMERSVMIKLQKLGMLGVSNEELGSKLFQSLTPRIQTILARSCAPGADNDNEKMVNAFEQYLVSLALANSGNEINPSNLGYPPQQPQKTYDMFTKIFSRPPKIVMRSKTRHRSSSSNNSNELNAVLIPTVHFYFTASDNVASDDGQVKSSSAFCRILLYAVCQFHGLVSASSLMSSNGKHHIRKSSKKQDGGIKMVTVQGGVMLAPSLKLLDHVEDLS